MGYVVTLAARSRKHNDSRVLICAKILFSFVIIACHRSFARSHIGSTVGIVGSAVTGTSIVLVERPERRVNLESGIFHRLISRYNALGSSAER